MTKRTIATITIICALIIGLGVYGNISGKNDNTDQFGHSVQTTITTTNVRSQLETCKKYIVDNKDFPGYKSKECKGIQEDDYRLNVAYRAINPNGTGTLCEQMYALAQADEEHSYELTHLLQSYGMTEDVLVANFDVCEALGYTWAE